VFDAQGKLWLDEYQAAATEEELEKIKQMCSEVRFRLGKHIKPSYWYFNNLEFCII